MSGHRDPEKVVREIKRKACRKYSSEEKIYYDDILVEDDAEIKRLNLTHEKIAARMQELRDAGKEGLGDLSESR